MFLTIKSVKNNSCVRKLFNTTMKKFLKIELNQNRIYGLDILRALAILFVVIGHGKLLLPKDNHKYINPFIYDGVSIFFVLSGFLIGGILIKIFNKNKMSWNLIGHFWIRRWFRTLPNYFLILLVLIALNSFFVKNFEIGSVKWYFFFSQNLFSEHPTFFPEAWSISIEEWFYLIIPIIIFSFIKLFKISFNKSILITAFSLIILVTFHRYYRFEASVIDNITWDLSFRKQVSTRLDSLMFGVIGAFVHRNYYKLWDKYKVLLFIIGIIIFISLKYNLFQLEKYGLFYCVFSFSLISIATLFLIPFLVSIKNGKGFLYKSLTYISLISYSMYLINLTIVQFWILGNIEWSLLSDFNGYLYLSVRYALYWVLTIVISIIIYKFFEIPLMNLRDKVNIKSNRQNHK